MKRNKLDIEASKVVAALISLGCYQIDVKKDEGFVSVVSFQGNPINSPYSKILVYKDGIVHYYFAGSLRFEGTTKRQSTIILDILHK